MGFLPVYVIVEVEIGDTYNKVKGYNVFKIYQPKNTKCFLNNTKRMFYCFLPLSALLLHLYILFCFESFFFFGFVLFCLGMDGEREEDNGYLLSCGLDTVLFPREKQ